MNELGIIDRFTETFSRYIDSGFGLLSGDVAFLPGSVAGEVRNDGDEIATGTAVLVIPSEEMEGMMAEATPTS